MMEITPINVIAISLFESAATFYLFPQVWPGGTLASFIAVFLALNLSFYAFYKLVVYPFFRSPFRHLPHPPTRGWPILGHGLVMFQRPAGESHLKFIKETENDGLIAWRSFFHVDRLLVTGPAAIADVLVHNSYDYEKPPWTRNFLRIFLGDGLLLTEGDDHKHQRKHIMPAFHFRHIKELYPVFWSKSIELCDSIKAELHDKPDSAIDIGHLSTQVTMDIIGMAGLGRDIGSLRNSDDELIKNYEEILQPTYERFAYFVLHLLLPRRVIRALPWKLNESVEITTSNLKRICTDFVAEKKSRMKMESQESKDILSIMLRSNNFSDDNLVDQLLTFLAAGHETTSSALTWATHLLATHPEIQTRLRAEIHENIPDPAALSDPSFDIPSLLESLPYLNAVCKEVLRLYPTLPVSARFAIRDTTITGQFVPKGTLLLIVPWATNRDPKLWGPDSEVFRPERWLDTSTGRAAMGGAESNYAFLTFFHGPRSCIGQVFARAELRALVAAVAGQFEMRMADPTEKIRVGGTITSKPINGMRLRLTPVVWGSAPGVGK
ncbi:cytochrome P450 [Lentithecium fluviatile CBS 122367]|uniref:Cytochrome P450 n=1 Tax=Lentithecium fluviatile CBS 122367 TaxID=1168545 RepID=A0A6G1IKA4_9PLEO|nr:cytochrome P450 [Lentithecium fluviatile CBS 122367]